MVVFSKKLCWFLHWRNFFKKGGLYKGGYNRFGWVGSYWYFGELANL